MNTRSHILSLISHLPLFLNTSYPLLVLAKHNRNILEPLSNLSATSWLSLCYAYRTPMVRPYLNVSSYNCRTETDF